MSGLGPGCVKTRLSQGRAELFSQLPSPNRSCQCNRFSTTTKSRRKFYAQVQRRSFHTAWVKTGKALCEHMLSDTVAKFFLRYGTQILGAVGATIEQSY